MVHSQAARREGIALASKPAPQLALQQVSNSEDKQQVSGEQANKVSEGDDCALPPSCGGERPPSLDASINFCQGPLCTSAEGGHSVLGQPRPEAVAPQQSAEAVSGCTMGTSYPSVPANEDDQEHRPSTDGGLLSSPEGMGSAKKSDCLRDPAGLGSLAGGQVLSVRAHGTGHCSDDEHEKLASTSCQSAPGSGHEEGLEGILNIEASCALPESSSLHARNGDGGRPSNVENLASSPGRFADGVERNEHCCQASVAVSMPAKAEEVSDAAVPASRCSASPLRQKDGAQMADKREDGSGLVPEPTELRTMAQEFIHADGIVKEPSHGERLTSCNFAERLRNDGSQHEDDGCCLAFNAAGSPADLLGEVPSRRMSLDGVGELRSPSDSGSAREMGIALSLGVDSQCSMEEDVANTVKRLDSHLQLPAMPTGVAVSVPTARIQGDAVTPIEGSAASPLVQSSSVGDVLVSATPRFEMKTDGKFCCKVSKKIRKRMRGRSGTNLQWYKVGRVWRVF